MNSIININEGKAILRKYKEEKASLERRIAEESKFWERTSYEDGEPRSSWLFSSIVNKHADIIDNIPTCSCLPREPQDERDADLLSRILPVITERSGFSQQYSDNSWEKLKHGGAIYGVFWNSTLENGKGDIDIRSIALSDIFWQDGITDIQDSKNLFICAFCDPAELEAIYGDFSYEQEKSADEELASYLYGSRSDGDGRCLCVDWYFKRFDEYGRQRLCFCKFVGNKLLYFSDDWYDHGRYPVVIDSMYPEKGSPYGIGMIAIASSTQRYIDRIDGNLLRYTDWASRVRFWAKRSLGVDEEQFCDLEHNIVELEGDIDEEKLRQIEIRALDENIIEIKKLKLEELKEITGCREMSVGGTLSGVTAASAISLLQEAGNKSSRDGIEGSHRTFILLMQFCIELIRQFYDRPRCFRITGSLGENIYISYSGESIKGSICERTGILSQPIFDLEIRAKRSTPSEKNAKNAFARELYEGGAFSPEKASETLIMLEMMDFDGIGKIRAMLKRLAGQNVEREEENE